MNEYEKKLFLRDVLLLANIVQLANDTNLRMPLNHIAGDAEPKFNSSLVKWETFSNLSNRIKGE